MKIATLVSILAPLAIATPAQAQEPCVNLQWNSHHMGSNSRYLTVVAEVTNDCDRTLAWISYDGYLEDEAGVELDTTLANARNVAPGTSKRIQFVFQYSPEARQYTAEVRRARFE